MNADGIKLSLGLMDRVDSRIYELQQRMQRQYCLTDLSESYQTTHVINSPFPGRQRYPPSVLKRPAKPQSYTDYTLAQKRYICLKTLAKHKMLQKEFEVLQQRLKAASPTRKQQGYKEDVKQTEERPNYREYYAEIKRKQMEDAQQKRQLVKETESKAMLIKQQQQLQQQIKAQDIKAFEAELRVVKMQYSIETAYKTQQVKADVVRWAEQSKAKSYMREQRRMEQQELEMEELIENVMEKEDEIRYLQDQIQLMKQKMGRQTY